MIRKHSLLFKSLKKSVFVPAMIIVFLLLVIINTADIHDAELNFAEYSSEKTILGGMLPASCESIAYASPDHTAPCAWATYCSATTDPVPSTWWTYSNDNPRIWVQGASCAPASWNEYCTGPSDVNGNVWQNWAWGVDGAGRFLFINRNSSCRPVVNVY